MAIAATYRDSFVDASGDTVVPGGNLIVGSGQYAHGEEANRHPLVPGYTVVNLVIAITPHQRVELFGTISNLFDNHHATFGALGSNIHTGGNEQFRTPASGRAFLGGVRYRFGGKQAASAAVAGGPDRS